MTIDLRKLSDRHLLALHRVGKRDAFLRPVKAMIALRDEIERRGLRK